MNNHTIEVDKECGEKDMDNTHSHICLINSISYKYYISVSEGQYDCRMDNTFLFYLISVSCVVKNGDRNVLVILAMMSTRKTRQQRVLPLL